MSTHIPVASNIAPSRRDETHTQQVTAPGLLVARTAELRARVDNLSGDVNGLHQDTQEAELSQLTDTLSLTAARGLLDQLADDFGMAWALVARVVGVTPAAVRKWRRGETVTPAYHRRLAEFVAFCQLTRKRDPRIEDVGHWLETPAASRADITRADLYLDGHRAELLSVAGQHATGETVLDAADPAWRDRAARSRRWQVLHHEDGTTSVVDRPESA